jgi:hypothetical protein
VGMLISIGKRLPRSKREIPVDGRHPESAHA